MPDGVKSRVIRDDCSIVLGGEAGQGIRTIEDVLTRVLKLSGYNVFSTREYMSRIRGGVNTTEVRVSSKRVSAFLNRIDVLMPLGLGVIPRLGRRISKDTLIIGDYEVVGGDLKGYEDRFVNVPLIGVASRIGGSIYSNIVAVGVMAGLLEADTGVLEDYLRKIFSAKGVEVVNRNIAAAREGFRIGGDLSKSMGLRVELKGNPNVRSELLISGGEAVALGAAAGGCNFVAFYPMSPSTGISVFLAQHMEELGIIVEQAEDEISAINMALGAWYAGARAMVPTSGGGFDLMVEGLSLAGMIESPAVIHIGMRPGPATGLPTRTEQADLNIALYSGHGEFPRVILTPGTIEDAFYLTGRAFNLAEKYQVPVLILTDQYLIDSMYNIEGLNPHEIAVERHIVETSREYRRFKFSEDGLSPRGIPGYGKGLVCVDSDEHDEDGHITEDFQIRSRMVEKRLRKLEALRGEAIPPQLIGDRAYRILVVGWGSTYHPLREALELMGRGDISLLHFKQVYPLHTDAGKYLREAEETIIVEGNATSQFGRLIKAETGLNIDKRLLKYEGLPFAVEEIVEGLERLSSKR
ncbi:MAG: 2-oxoacid:acceptor oxidoreductase subunit alpha [Candidatus Bathyarchaeia archaeon]